MISNGLEGSGRNLAHVDLLDYHALLGLLIQTKKGLAKGTLANGPELGVAIHADHSSMSQPDAASTGTTPAVARSAPREHTGLCYLPWVSPNPP